MKKTTFTLIGLILFSVVLSCFVIILGMSKTIDAFNETNNNMSVNIGNKVLLDNDTLTIIDYKVIGNTYTLSNGVKIDANLVKTNLILP